MMIKSAPVYASTLSSVARKLEANDEFWMFNVELFLCVVRYSCISLSSIGEIPWFSLSTYLILYSVMSLILYSLSLISLKQSSKLSHRFGNVPDIIVTTYSKF